MRIHRIDRIDASELADYTQLTDVELRRVREPAEGLYLAESPKVIERALRAGHRPRSVLLLEEWLPRVEPLLAEHPDVPVYLGDSAQQMVWLIEEKEELHPILSIALGDSDEVVVRVPVAAGSEADGESLVALQLDIEPGFHVLAIRRGGRYVYRPRGHVRLQPDDELIASGPAEGHGLLAQRCGWHLTEDDDTGDHDLSPLRSAHA